MRKILFLFFFLQCTLFADNNKTALITIPKCGNFLLLKLMKNVSNKEGIHSSPNNRLLDWRKYFSINHECVKQETIDFCLRNDTKIIFIYRDPRDQVVSAAYYLKTVDSEAAKISIADMITSLINNSVHWWRIVGLPSKNGTICDFYDLMMKWTELPFVYPTTFEKIIGPKGGGDREIQIQEIKNIASYTGYILSQQEVENIADSLWGRHTFRVGKIGSWKTHFSATQKNRFKEVAGQLLIDLGYEKNFDW